MEKVPKLLLLIASATVIIIPGTDYAFATNGVWTAKAPMPTARDHLAVGVVNGILYAVGGISSLCAGPCSAVEAYNPSTNTWTTKAPMPTPRAGLVVGVVNGILYAVSDIVMAYNPLTNTWTTKAPIPTPRAGLAVGVVNGILYAVGGLSYACDGTQCGTVEAYNPSTNTWTTKAPMPTPRSQLAVGVVNGKLYAVGGTTYYSMGEGKPGPCGGPNQSDCSTVEAYDPSTNTWTTKAPLRTPRFAHAVGVVNGTLYSVGGYSGTCSGYCSMVEAYNPSTNTWTIQGSVPTPRMWLASTPRMWLASGVVNGILYVVGGYSWDVGSQTGPCTGPNHDVCNTVEAYSP
jgi:N-acetylneuraminic acid mutarotase